MYAYIKGKLIQTLPDAVIVEAGGIGYRIRTASGAFERIASVGEEIKAYTYLSVREDAMELFGFPTEDDLKVFQLLIGVSGIGPKGALGILSAMSADELRFAVLGDDAKAISAAPGIGPKTARRLIVELKDKFDLEETFEHALSDAQPTAHTQAGNAVKNDVMMALTALGYSSAEVMTALRKVPVTDESDVEEVLKAALKEL